MTLNIAVIGCGAMGKGHMNAWNKRDDAQVVALFDVVEQARTAAAEEIGATPYDTYQGAIDHEGIDAISICTPTPFHREIACYAAEKGRHILCEKPLAGTVEDCDAIVKAVQRHKVWCTVGHQHREGAHSQRIKQLFDEGSLGSPLIGRFFAFNEVRPKVAMNRKSMNQGPVLDMSVHFFDMMRFFTGKEVTSVYARGHVFGRGKPRLAQIADDDYAYDAAELIANFEGGHILSVGANWGMPEGFPGGGSQRVTGPLGMVQNEAGKSEVILGDHQRETIEGGPLRESPRLADLAEAIQTGKPPQVSAYDGRQAACGCLAAIESIETGRIVDPK